MQISVDLQRALHLMYRTTVNPSSPVDLVRPSRLYVMARLLIGMALMVSGLSKVTGGQPLLLASSWVIPSAVIVVWGLVECVIGWIALTFLPHRSLRYVLTLLFTAFVGVLLVQWYSGSTQCPCLGSSGLPIKHVLLFDVFALISLVAFRSQWDAARFGAGSALGETIGSVKFVLPVVLGVAVIAFGSLDSALGYFSGRSLLATPATQFIGKVGANKVVTAKFRLRNASSLPIRVLGANSSCGCFAVEDLPVTIPPWKSQSIRVSLHAGAESGLRKETATLICDDSASQLTLGVMALVHPNRNAVDANSSFGE